MIRRATMADLPWLRKMHQDFCAEFPAHYPHMDEQEYDAFVVAIATAIRQDPSFLLMVAVNEKDQLLGYCGAGILYRVAGKPRQVCSICWCYVLPEHRGAGISRQFATEIALWLRTSFPNVTAIEIMANAGDDQWTKRGMQPFLVHHHCSLGLLDAYIRGENPSSRPVPAAEPPVVKKPRRKKPALPNGHDQPEAHDG